MTLPERNLVLTILSDDVEYALNSMPGATDIPPVREYEIHAPQAGTAPIVAKVSDIGEGVPVVFLHGLVGLNEHWDDAVERLTSSIRCIRLELPLLSLPRPVCSIGGVTELTRQFIAEYLDTPAVLVGNSFGGHVALRVALEYPQLCEGLVLAGSSGLIEKSIVRDVQIRPSREWLERKIGELFYDRSFMRQADLDRAHAELSERAKARAMVRLSRSARKNHLGKRIGNITTPTLLVWGRQDIVTPPEAAIRFHELLPDSRLVWFDHCGHVPMVERADDFAEELLRFVHEITPPSAETM